MTDVDNDPSAAHSHADSNDVKTSKRRSKKGARKDDGNVAATDQMTPVPCSRWREVETDFNLSRHLIPLLQNSPFYATISRYVKKRFTHDMPTAGMVYNIKEDELTLWVNPMFAGGGTYTDYKNEPVTCECLTPQAMQGLLIHEFMHPLFGHLTTRRREPAGESNVGQDLAIDSLIVQYAGQMQSGTDSTDNTNKQPSEETWPLPKVALVPGRRPHVDPVLFAKLPPRWQKANLRRCALIENFPPMKSSEWYFSELVKDAEQERKENGDGECDDMYIIGSMDNHDGWDGIPDSLREYVEGKVKNIIEKAVRVADGQANGWGNIPADMQAEIRRSISRVINWRAVTKQWIGSLVKGSRTTSIKRINRRYPYIHPGVKHNYGAKFMVAIDQSGSVSDDMLEMFFGELDTLTKKTSITLCHFDCAANESDLYEWKCGTRPKLVRTKSGGTDFDAPTRIVNDPRNRGRWDGLLIMTDGQASKPIGCRVKRGWIVGKGCELAFPTTDLVIKLDDDRPNQGAWR